MFGPTRLTTLNYVGPTIPNHMNSLFSATVCHQSVSVTLTSGRQRSKSFPTTAPMESAHQKTPSQESLKRPAENTREQKPKPKRSKMVFQTRCNPKLNFKLIHKFNGEGRFRKIICALGLDCLLHLRVTRLQRELCADLARKVDVGKSVLNVHGAEIPLTYASVTKIIGLPCPGVYEEVLANVCKEEQIRVCRKYCLDSAARISQYSLWEFLDENQTFDTEFKAKFLLFIIATLIRPTTNVNLHFKYYISMLKDMDAVGEFNWARFLLDGLLDAIYAFQERGAKSLGGCLLYLQLVYLHCVSPVPWTRYDACLMATPNLRNWTDERVSVVLKLLREQGGIDSNMVVVKLAGIPPVDATVDNYLLPQVLVHEVLISRLQRRLDDTDAQTGALITQLATGVQNLEQLYRPTELQ